MAHGRPWEGGRPLRMAGVWEMLGVPPRLQIGASHHSGLQFRNSQITLLPEKWPEHHL